MKTILLAAVASWALTAAPGFASEGSQGGHRGAAGYERALLAEAGDNSGVAVQFAEAGGGNSSGQPQYAEAGGGNGSRQYADAGGGDGGRAPAYAASPAPVGDWLTANGHGVVQIAQCGDTLCGRIVGIDRRPGTAMPTDAQGRPQCGLTIITDETRTPDGTWLGHITDPRDGSTYQAEIWVDGVGRLHLRGFVGIPLFGQTQIWHRFTSQLRPECGIG